MIFANAAPIVRELSGFEPDKLSTFVLRLYPGTCSSASGAVTAVSLGAIDIDLGVAGRNGIDVGQTFDGVSYHVYLISRDADGDIAAVVSASRFYSEVIVPEGHSLVRKLPFGFVFRSAWGGIPDFHVTHWPKPLVTLTGHEDSGDYRALFYGESEAFAEFSLENFLPDNARLAWLCLETMSFSTAGSAYLRSSASQQVGMLCGSVNPITGASAVVVMPIRVTSERKLEFRTTGGAILRATVMGYSMTEPS